KAFEPDGKLHMLAIAGDRSTPSSINRNLGMHRAVAEAPMVVLEEEVYAAWARENAAQQAESLYRRYPDVKLVWAGNDRMSFGAMAAWEKRGGKPGVHAWFSGVNPSTEALEAVKSGRLTSLAGGHFITGAWALVMIYDYHHGRDFADERLELRRPDVRRVHAGARRPLHRAFQRRLCATAGTTVLNAAPTRWLCKRTVLVRFSPNAFLNA